jgi:hypothetical protein
VRMMGCWSGRLARQASFEATRARARGAPGWNEIARPRLAPDKEPRLGEPLFRDLLALGRPGTRVSLKVGLQGPEGRSQWQGMPYPLFPCGNRVTDDCDSGRQESVHERTGRQRSGG